MPPLKSSGLNHWQHPGQAQIVVSVTRAPRVTGSDEVFFCMLYRDQTLNLRLTRSFRVGNESAAEVIDNGQEAFVYQWKTFVEMEASGIVVDVTLAPYWVLISMVALRLAERGKRFRCKKLMEKLKLLLVLRSVLTTGTGKFFGFDARQLQTPISANNPLSPFVVQILAQYDSTPDEMWSSIDRLLNMPYRKVGMDIFSIHASKRREFKTL